MLPADFTQRIQQQLGHDEYLAFLKALNETPPVSIRINHKKIKQSLAFETVPWASHAYYLPNRPLFAFDPLWHGGAYYVQEAGSMLLEIVFKQLHFAEPNIKVLDLCAAPGGKSTHLLSLLQQHDLLVANEVIAPRNSLLRENLIKWGHENIIVTQNDPKDFQKLPDFFDVIVIDAPCSGEGLFRKDAAAMQEWSEANIQHCVARQQRIVADVLPALKPNGYIIYSTCTYNEQENEQQLLWMQQQNTLISIDVSTHHFPHIKKDKYGGLHCWPHQTKSEGFFIVALQNTAAPKIQNIAVQKVKSALLEKETAMLQHLIHSDNPLAWLQHDETYYAFPQQLLPEWQLIKKHLYIKYFGVAVAQIKNRQIIPQPNLAFAIQLNQNSFNTIAMPYKEAVAYLQKNNLNIEAANGWHLITYQNMALGFIKSINGRINNYFPTEWRLRKVLNNGEVFSLPSTIA